MIIRDLQANIRPDRHRIDIRGKLWERLSSRSGQIRAEEEKEEETGHKETEKTWIESIKVVIKNL